MELVTPLMQQVYSDCKHLTISAHSYPSRVLANIMASELDLEKEFVSFEPSPEMFVYLNPVQHAEFAHMIATCGRIDLEGRC